MVTCTGCGDPLDPMDAFPGDVCLPCWESSEEGQRTVTAEELISMWKGLA